jgi:YgiT-type zinc finger domain-containing protein
MISTITDLPFKRREQTIIIVKDLPVWQCTGCQEYLIDDPVMERVEELLATVNTAAELEVIRYAA